MNHKIHNIKTTKIIEIKERGIIIKDPKDILDMIANLGSRKIALYKKNIDENFFDLKNGLAGEILQKASNYSLQIGIIGDYKKYKRESLQAFIYESNRTNQIVFAETLNEVLQRFGK